MSRLSRSQEAFRHPRTIPAPLRAWRLGGNPLQEVQGFENSSVSGSNRRKFFLNQGKHLNLAASCSPRMSEKALKRSFAVLSLYRMNTLSRDMNYGGKCLESHTLQCPEATVPSLAFIPKHGASHRVCRKHILTNDTTTPRKHKFAKPKPDNEF